MTHCSHHKNDVLFNITDLIQSLGLDFNSTGLILTLFLTGLSASFTHCISMCGPIALAQMSMRFMHLPKEKLSEWNKLKCAFALPYYLGKSFTYVLLMLIAMAFSQNFRNIPYIKWFAFFLLISTALIFIKSGITKTFRFFDLPYKRKLDNILIKKVNTLSLNPFGFKGFIMGAILGLIPCGIVYASIVTIISATTNYIIATIAMFVFGFATVPGLLLVSYIGEQIFSRYKLLFSSLYALMMFINAYLLLSYAFKLIR